MTGEAGTIRLNFPAAPTGLASNNDIAGLTIEFVTISETGYSFTGSAFTLTGSITVDPPPPSSISWSIPVTLTGTPGIIVNGTGTIFTMSGVISGTSITKTGTGELRLSAANTYTGATNVNDGIVNVRNASALGTAAGSTAVASGATVEIQGVSSLTVAEPLSLSGTGFGGMGALFLDVTNTWSGPITLVTPDATIATQNVNGSAGVSGVISGGGGLTKMGRGALDISGSSANTYLGLTTLASGIINANKIVGPCVPGNLVISGTLDPVNKGYFNPTHSVELAATSTVTINDGTFNIPGAAGVNQPIPSLTMTKGVVSITSGGTLTLTGDVSVLASSTSSTISGAGTVMLGTATRTFTVADGAAADDLVVSTVVDGGVGLIKEGPGRMVVSGANPYGGPTSVNAGSLIVNGMQQFSNVTVASGATLGGSGTVRNITAASGATVAPGASPGILSCGPAVALNAGSTFAVELNGTTVGTQYDQLNVAGSVTLAGFLSVTFGFTPAVSNTFTIVQASTAVTGTFAGLAEGATLCASGRTLQIHYTATTVTLTVTALTDTTAPTVTAPAAATATQTICQ